MICRIYYTIGFHLCQNTTKNAQTCSNASWRLNLKVVKIGYFGDCSVKCYLTIEKCLQFLTRLDGFLMEMEINGNHFRHSWMGNIRVLDGNLINFGILMFHL